MLIPNRLRCNNLKCKSPNMERIRQYGIHTYVYCSKQCQKAHEFFIHNYHEKFERLWKSNVTALNYFPEAHFDIKEEISIVHKASAPNVTIFNKNPLTLEDLFVTQLKGGDN